MTPSGRFSRRTWLSKASQGLVAAPVGRDRSHPPNGTVFTPWVALASPERHSFHPLASVEPLPDRRAFTLQAMRFRPVRHSVSGSMDRPAAPRTRAGFAAVSQASLEGHALILPEHLESWAVEHPQDQAPFPWKAGFAAGGPAQTGPRDRWRAEPWDCEAPVAGWLWAETGLDWHRSAEGVCLARGRQKPEQARPGMALPFLTQAPSLSFPRPPRLPRLPGAHRRALPAVLGLFSGSRLRVGAGWQGVPGCRITNGKKWLASGKKRRILVSRCHEIFNFGKELDCNADGFQGSKGQD